MTNLEHIIIGNAAGTVKTIGDMKRMCNTSATRITVGSVTKHERTGNTNIGGGSPYYYDSELQASVNAIGLQNAGMAAYRSMLPELVRLARQAGKKLWISVAGFTPDEYAELTEAGASLRGVDGIELNLGCPNIHDSGRSKTVPSYHPPLAGEILDAVAEVQAVRDRDVRIGVKISPVEDERPLRVLARKIAIAEFVDTVIAVNTIPNHYMTDAAGNPALNFIPQGSNEVMHRGGLAGAPLLKDGLRVVSFIRKELPTTIDIIGCGGIFSGADAQHYLQAGACGFEIATAYLELGPRIFQSVAAELVELVEA